MIVRDICIHEYRFGEIKFYSIPFNHRLPGYMLFFCFRQKKCLCIEPIIGSFYLLLLCDPTRVFRFTKNTGENQFYQLEAGETDFLQTKWKLD